MSLSLRTARLSALLQGTERGSHRAETGSQSTAPRKWRMGARRHQECWVWERGQDVRLHPFPQFLRLLSEDSGPPPSSVCSGGKAEAFSFGVSQVTLDPSRSSKSWQEPLPIPTVSLSSIHLGTHSTGRPWKTHACNPMDCSMPGFSAHHQPPELPQTHVH